MMFFLYSKDFLGFFTINSYEPLLTLFSFILKFLNHSFQINTLKNGKNNTLNVHGKYYKIIHLQHRMQTHKLQKFHHPLRQRIFNKFRRIF